MISDGRTAAAAPTHLGADTMKTALLTATAAVAALLSAPAALAATPAGADAGQAAAKRPITAPRTTELPGATSVPGGYASWGELMKVQGKLGAAADRIIALDASGLAGIRVSAETKSLQVAWKGAAPASVRRAAGLGAGLNLRITSARYSQRELLAAAARVARGSHVASVAPQADGSGLLVAMRSGTSTTTARTASVARLAGGVPVTYERAAAPAPAFSRGNDIAPYWGGARWNGCSTGFAIRIGGVPKMLSAGHCASNGQNAYDGGGDWMGTVSGDSDAYDRLYINTNSAGRIYDGGVGSGEFSKPVIGAARSYVGDWLCTSGAYSGARCGIQVRATNVTIWVGSYYIYQLVRAEQVNYQNAIGNGDSGGPVFSLAADHSKVIAKGTNTAIDLGTQVACTGIPASATRRCAWRMYYVDVVNSLNAYGASIITG
jgi:hypothetical protein